MDAGFAAIASYAICASHIRVDMAVLYDFLYT
jgi:hypothetical protein